RVSMGTVFQMPWTRLPVWPGGLGHAEGEGIDRLRPAGFTVAGLALAQNAIDLAELEADPPEKLALVLGTEGDGLGHQTIAACDMTVQIPMAGDVDSLNVAAAAAVAFWSTRVRCWPARAVTRN